MRVCRNRGYHLFSIESPADQDLPPTRETTALDHISTRSQKPTRPGPTPRRERLENLDLLRGLAVCAAVPVTVDLFSKLTFSPWSQTAVYSPHGADQTFGDHLWILNQLLFGAPIFVLFGVAFGAGLYFNAGRSTGHADSLTNLPSWLGRAWAATYLNRIFGESAVGLNMRRMGLLFVLGILMFLGLWRDDKLALFALTGIIAYAAVPCPPQRIFILAGTALAVASFGALWMARIAIHADPVLFSQIITGGGNEVIAVSRQQFEALTGPILGQIAWRLSQLTDPMSLARNILTFGQIVASTLVGLALANKDIFSPGRLKSRHLSKIIIGFAVGIPLVLTGIIRDISATPLPSYIVTAGDVLQAWGAYAVAVGEFGLIVLMTQISAFQFLRKALVGLGQLPLTNYILTIVICAILFHVMGLLNRLAWYLTLPLSALIWAAQIAFTLFWISHCRQGPAEWLLRKFIYGGFQPLFAQSSISSS